MGDWFYPEETGPLNSKTMEKLKQRSMMMIMMVVVLWAPGG
jgi:hypothetical protein